MNSGVYAIITPLKAIRMLLDGSGVLVRAEKWVEIQDHLKQCKMDRRRRSEDALAGEGGVRG